MLPFLLMTQKSRKTRWCAQAKLLLEIPFQKLLNSFHPGLIKKIVAWILHYKSTLYHLSKKKRRGVTSQIQSTGTTTPISIAELNNAELEILKQVQKRCFKEELACLKNADNQATSSRQNALKKSSNIFKLNPILSQGLIQVGGCL